MDKQLSEPAAARGRSSPDVPEDLDALCVELLRPRPRGRPAGEDDPDAPRRRTPAVPGRVRARACPRRRRAAVRRPRAPTAAALADGLRGHRRGAGRSLVFVHGPSGRRQDAPGAARSSTRLAARDEAVVLSGRCYERESVPYKALDSLIDALSRYLRRLPAPRPRPCCRATSPPLARVFPVLRRVEAVAEAPRRAAEIPDPQELRRRRLRRAPRLLARLGDRRPLVLAIDDLQWGDADSLGVLSEILRPPDPRSPAPGLLPERGRGRQSRSCTAVPRQPKRRIDAASTAASWPSGRWSSRPRSAPGATALLGGDDPTRRRPRRSPRVRGQPVLPRRAGAARAGPAPRPTLETQRR